MSIKPMERIWKSQWPDFWEDTFEYGRESLVWHLYHNAFRFRDKTFMVFYGTEFTWKEFKDLVWKAAGGLKKLGINKVTGYTLVCRTVLSS